MLEQQVVRYLESLRSRHPLPVTIALWDGTEVPLGGSRKVGIRLKSTRAARYLLKPSLDALGEFKADQLSLTVSDFFESPATAIASHVFPAAAFSEKEGTFLNHANLAQTLHKVSRAPQETRQEGQLFMDLAHKKGLFNLAAVRKELAKEVTFFAKLGEQVPESGVKLV